MLMVGQVPHWCQATLPTHLNAYLNLTETLSPVVTLTSPISPSPSLNESPPQPAGMALSSRVVHLRPLPDRG
jgi:hypothetical protein